MNEITIMVTAADALNRYTGWLELGCAEDRLGELILERVSLEAAPNESLESWMIGGRPGHTYRVSVKVSWDRRIWIALHELVDQEKATGLMIGPKATAALLRQQEVIPDCWRGRGYALPGVRRCHPHDGSQIAMLYEQGGPWHLGWVNGRISRSDHMVLRISRSHRATFPATR